MSSIKPTRVPVWEKRRKEKKKSRLIRFVILVVIAFFLINIIIKIPGLYRDFNQPFPRFSGENEKTQNLDSSFRTNYLLVSYSGGWLQDAAIVSHEPEDRRLSLLLLRLHKNKKLRLSTNKSFRNGGIGSLSKQISIELGVIFDRYIAFEKKNMYFTAENASSTYEQIKSLGIFFKAFSLKKDLNKYLKTNFTTSELVSFLWDLRSAKFEDKDTTSLSDFGLPNLQSEEGSGVLSNLFFDRSIIEEGASVNIRNSSGVVGLGSRLSLYIENLGASVVVVETGEETTQESSIVAVNRKSRMEKRIGSLISLKSGGEDEEFSGDVLFILGKQAADELTFE
jgi:hypothetical protein